MVSLDLDDVFHGRLSRGLPYFKARVRYLRLNECFNTASGTRSVCSARRAVVLEALADKQEYLGSKITDRKIRYTHHDAKVSRIEAVLARGDRRLSDALELAAKEGFKFDAWDECFDYDRWISVIEKSGLDAAFYANRAFDLDEVLPWDIIDCGVSKEFLRRERDKAYAENTTPSCREKCSGCGANKLGGERTCCPKLAQKEN